MKYAFCTVQASAAGRWVAERIDELQVLGGSPDPFAVEFDPELGVLSRLAGFRFSEYPDHTAPWHLVSWPHMRWTHVFNIVTVIEHLRQPTGSHVGAPITLDPFQVFIVLAFLGPEDPDTGLRLIKEGLLTIGRKNGKTALTAGLATALMSIDPDDHGLRGQEIQVGAADREQAGITHMMCERFVTLDETLGIKDAFHSIPSKKTMHNKRTLTSLRCLSSDAYRAHGGNPAMVILDEIGNVPATQAEEFYSVLTTGYGAQDEPLTLLLSTQAPNDQHFFSQQVDRAKRVNEGAITADNFAGFVFELPELDAEGVEVDPFDEDVWFLANPGIGSICSLQDMRDWCKRARDLPTLQNKYENLRLNRRVSETSAFVSRVVWERNNKKFDPEELKGATCYAGLDLAETTDLASLVLVFEPQGHVGRHPVIPFFWIPGNGLQQRSDRDKVPYTVWSKDGMIDTSSSNTIDYAKIAKRIVQCIDEYDLRAVGFDRWKMRYLRTELAKLGYEWDTKLDDPFLVEIGQGFKDQSRSVQLLEDALVESRLAHAGHPILRWNAGNAVILRDPALNRKFEKARSFGRIDGVVALSLALHARDLKTSDDAENQSRLGSQSLVM